MWGIEALKDDYEVSLITAGNVDLDGLNRFYGTSVKDNEITVWQAPIPSFLRRMNGAAALRGALYQRFCRKLAKDFDVLISTYNLCDFGVPAIHCLADFSWDDEIRTRLDPIPPGPGKVIYRDTVLRKCYLRLARALSAPSGRNLFAGKDLILANSRWTANIIRQKYGVEADMLYPPVAAAFPCEPFKEKEMGFVSIGRISQEKRIERIIEILTKVRRRGHRIHLHVIGQIDGTAYGRMVRKLCYNYPDWIKVEGSCHGEKKQRLLSRHRFGIHGRKGEPFGIAVAEMVKAGCIVFVPNEGGQAEIVNNQSLLYESVEDAVNKIDAVLRQSNLQDDFLDHLEEQGEKFSTSKFMNGMRTAVEEFLHIKQGRNSR
jgi:glycosyltransferase involved in cell wall biosynthesis